ncbi:MAG: multicopper oxidase domain-containing protein, partial [Anaerolineae bacterium]|nr:multicopper oxidase domain-containing protein [Anaerolineae bacterium]
MRTRMTKLIGLGVVLVAMALLLVNTPVQAHWPTPATDQLSQNAPAHPQPPPVEAAIQQPALPAAQASPTFDLCASDGEITLPDSTTVTVWGFVDTDGGSCTTGLVNSLPGPELHVNDGDTVTINLTNALAENVSILIPGQNVTESGGVAGLFAAEAAANGGTVSYNFTAQEGAYLYESGTNPSIQIPMGLYGALIVDSGVTGQAYGNAFDQEAVLLLSEIDPNLNANPGNFNLLNYHPTYWLINGAAYPDVPAIVANPGERVLLRYLNAGFDHPSMTLLGGYQRVIAKEGFKLNHSFDAVAETIPAGATADMIVNTAGLQGNLALYNRNMYVTNGDAYPGGMLTFLNLSAPTGMPPMADMVAPVNDAIITGNMVLVQIDASDVEDDANLGAGNLSVNWDVDGGTPQMAVYNGVSGYYEATLDTTALNDGAHIINASVTDSDNNIVYVSNNVNVDNGAPVDNPPTVNAGVDQSIILPDAATLDGTVTDDGLSTLITAWSMTSGPGIVTFGDASL